MKKALIAYFSQGGTTRSISEQIQKGLNDKQIQVDLYDILDGPLSGPGIVYTIENLITKKFLAKYIYSYFFKADADKCDSCKVCLKKCPNTNIHLDKNGIPKWGRNCLFCFYCEMKCPKDAIKSPIDWLIMAPFMSYNVYQANRDPLVDQAKVVHSKGKTKRV